MRGLLILFAPTLLIAAASAPQPSFQVGATRLSLPLPAGYCEPTGRQAAVAQTIAAADLDNVTHLSLVRCEAPLVTGVGDYTLVKTPKTALAVVIDRPAFLAAMGAAFDNPAVTQAITDGKMADRVAERLGTLIGGKPGMTTAIKPLGRDDTCAYMGGTIAVKTDKVAYTQPMGACMTTAADKMVVVYRYGPDADARGIVRLLREAKAVARTIGPAR